ncbi:unnamed protein product [Rhizophagus irregularis]|nr:unnamed protein product [Rhizophagus irregularis]CAB4434515.1 unnamed protein product [Rhizophagus irregularis]
MNLLLIQLSIVEFLQQLDEIEETGDYYFKFLEGFEKQQIKVKHLSKLSNKQFEACRIITIGDIKTIRDAACKKIYVNFGIVYILLQYIQ